MKTEIKELYKNEEGYLEKEIEINGWIKTIRSSGGIGFLEITDGSFFRGLQVVFDSVTGFSRNDTVLENAFEQIEKLPIYSGIKVTGFLQKSPAKGQIFELKAIYCDENEENFQKILFYYPLNPVPYTLFQRISSQNSICENRAACEFDLASARQTSCKPGYFYSQRFN